VNAIVIEYFLLSIVYLRKMDSHQLIFKKDNLAACDFRCLNALFLYFILLVKSKKFRNMREICCTIRVEGFKTSSS